MQSVTAEYAAVNMRAYQLTAISAVREAFRAHQRVLLVMPTGTGKTAVFSEIAKRVNIKGGKVLVLQNRSELIDQSKKALESHGLRVGVEKAGSHGIDNTTVPDVVIASVQSMRGERMHAYQPRAFSLIVCDEAHHSTAKTYTDILDYFFEVKVLGVTATPDRADGTPLADVFSYCAYTYEIGAAMRDGWLCAASLLDIAVEQLDLSKIKTRCGEPNAAELDAEILQDGVLHAIAKPLADHVGTRQTIAFCPGVKSSERLAEVLEGYGIKATHVHGGMDADDRKMELRRYRAGQVQVICNAMLLTEGYDAPETACVALVRPTTSRSLLVQMIGRGLRIAPDKPDCLVMNFSPGRVKAKNLICPEDVLGAHGMRNIGENWKAKAKREAAEAEEALAVRKREIVAIGVMYAACRMPLSELLEVMCAPDNRGVSEKQVAALKRAGFAVGEIETQAEAQLCFEIMNQRRAAGLCTYRQGKMLASKGLRSDVTPEQAAHAMMVLERNGWRDVGPLANDPEFRVTQ